MPIDYKAIGSRIAYYRKLNGLTAAQLSERVHKLSRDNLAKIETGNRESLDVGMLMDIAAALGVPHLALLLDITRPESEVEFGPSLIVRVSLSDVQEDEDGLHGEGVEVFRDPMKVSEALAWNSFEPMRVDLVSTNSAATSVVYRSVAAWRRYRRARSNFDLASRFSPDEAQNEKDLRYAVRELWGAYREATSMGLDVEVPKVAEPDEDDFLREQELIRKMFDNPGEAPTDG